MSELKSQWVHKAGSPGSQLQPTHNFQLWAAASGGCFMSNSGLAIPQKLNEDWRKFYGNITRQKRTHDLKKAYYKEPP